MLASAIERSRGGRVGVGAHPSAVTLDATNERHVLGHVHCYRVDPAEVLDEAHDPVDVLEGNAVGPLHAERRLDGLPRPAVVLGPAMSEWEAPDTMRWMVGCPAPDSRNMRARSPWLRLPVA